MYSKEVTATILADFAKGASAEETRLHLEEVLGVKPALNTIYAHRKSVTVEQLVDELLRQQERDITKETDSYKRMMFRDKLLDKLMPLKQEIVTKNLNINREIQEVRHVIELVDPDNPAPTYPQTQIQTPRRTNPIPP